MPKTLNIAHRGASGHGPENTMIAFQKALDMGAHMIELDLQITCDHQFVVLHDRSLLRTTGCRGSVRRWSLGMLQGLDAGTWFDRRYARETIPTLGAVLAWAGSRVRLNLEIKRGWPDPPELARKLLDCLEHFAGCPPLISSFDRGILRQIRSLDSSIALGLLSKRESAEQAFREARSLSARSLHRSMRTASPALIRRCQSEGLPLYLYTLDGADEMKRWIDLGVDGIFTNYPDRLSALLSGT